MAWLDRLCRSLFGGAVQRTGTLHHGPLIRSSAYADRFKAWRSSDGPRDLLSEWRTEFRKALSGADARMDLIRTPQATGMRIAFGRVRHRDAARYLMDLFAERSIALDYQQQMCDLRIGMDGTYRERRYLKPAQVVGSADGTTDQRFGNVMIEAWGPGPHLEGLKVLITQYNDRLYKPAVSGLELLERLLAEPGRERSC